MSVVLEWQVGDEILDLYGVTSAIGDNGMGKVFLRTHRTENTVSVPCRLALGNGDSLSNSKNRTAS